MGQPLAFLLGLRSGRDLAKFRTPLPSVEVVPRIWPREGDVLRAVGRHVGGVPRCLADFGEWSLHTYLAGFALVDEVPHGPVGSERLAALADFFARLADVPSADLPPLPADWPDEGDSRSFLAWLHRFTDREVHEANRPRFGELFDAVGVTREVVERFMTSVPELSRRPFALLHTDVHRSNVLVVEDPDGARLAVIDWELAMYGDPLHDLATHLVRMAYDKTEHELMVRMWRDAMCDAGHADMTVGLDHDLPVYLRFEYAQSVFPDVMRAALALADRPAEQELAGAAEHIRRALHRAREPLALVDVPDERRTVDALRRWQAAEAVRRQETDGAAEGLAGPDVPGLASDVVAHPEAAPRMETHAG
ncbi:phosphotransferase family protein [Streptomyces sp. NPDC057740]|uniref:phosphotransferase family protein n=1 Tax=Streptomyces sp. NPDC057740 TaxID=3346234 RepID=UPI0036C18037